MSRIFASVYHKIPTDAIPTLFFLRKNILSADEKKPVTKIGTTSNIYTHLNYNSKINSANKILDYFPQ